ncbi:uncharacterized protein LOC126879634 isoform X2 [Diabrotica virgifera virgifera]|uniref:PPIase cyclophilin-type domain-containing protein n=1 Tax=Diabrotica virgifera virgifera TaxID=50390 RepID=A0ABM5JLF8_DIAVI|nr:uncharacterized protein LOC126879634 isoform X2 [Diabrotica virgifera virgifera]
MPKKKCCNRKKKKVFKPVKTFRYLPGSVSNEVNYDDLHTYNCHRYRVLTCHEVVDTKPFSINPFRMLPRRKMVEDLFQSESIDKKNKHLLYKINFINRNGESHYSKSEMDKRWKKVMFNFSHSSKFPLVITLKVDHDAILKSQPSISEDLCICTSKCLRTNRPKCFLEFSVKDGEYLGKIIIELYFDFVPVTVQNFMEICEGKKLTYKNCLVHRIVRGQYMESGDITLCTGRGGTSIYGKTFSEENHLLKHSKAGVLSMKRLPPTDNNSQFIITFAKMEQMDHKNVVFGKIIKGYANLLKVQDYGRKIGKPYVDIIICNCGLVNT